MKGYCLLIALAGGVSLYAAPVGNPAFPQLLKEGYAIPNNCWVDFRLGYEGDFIGDGRMKQYNEGHGRVDNYEQYTNSGTVTLNFLDRLDIYGVFGSTRVSSDWRFEAVDSAVHRVELETNYHFLWAVGARGILFEWGNTILGIGGRYNATCHLKPVWTCIDGNPVSTSGTRFRWREWQVDLGMTHKIEIFIPYLGLKYSNSHARVGRYSDDIASDSGLLHMKNRTPVGIIIGCTLTTEKYFMLNVEGRLIDENALTIAGDFRF